MGGLNNPPQATSLPHVFPAELPLCEGGADAAYVHVQTIRHAGCEGALDSGADLVERVDGLAVAAECLHDLIVLRAAQLAGDRRAGGCALQFALQAPASVISPNHDYRGSVAAPGVHPPHLKAPPPPSTPS